MDEVTEPIERCAVFPRGFSDFPDCMNKETRDPEVKGLAQGHTT